MNSTGAEIGTVGGYLYQDHVMLLDAQDAFFMARKPRKDSPHTTAAYRRDLSGITSLLAGNAGGSVAELTIEDVAAQSLRAAFGEFADGHAKTSVSRALSTWNQFLPFC